MPELTVRPAATPDVYSEGEIADAAGVRLRDIQALVRAGLVQPLDGRGQYFSAPAAVLAVRAATGRATGGERPVLRPVGSVRREAGLPVALAIALHAGLFCSLFYFATLGSGKPAASAQQDKHPLRLVFLMTPGAGGGGGGGGHKEPAPPPPAAQKAMQPRVLRSPIPLRRPPPPIDPPLVVRAVEPPPLRVERLPAIVAPVIPFPADTHDRVGLPLPPARAAPAVESHGPGVGAGAGVGQGTGLGEGHGPGIGEGTGGGTGGGPFRPGSAISPPDLLREVKPDYTEDARRRNLEGDVVLEIIVRSDGSVGDVRLLQGLGAGLDQRATDAVRQWRFSPAHRQGTPVDVIVEVAVEFKLR